MQQKSVLIFIDWFTPGYKAGGPTRSMANMSDYLAGDFDLFIVTRNTDYMETKPYLSVVSDKWNLVAPNVHVFYASNERVSLRLYKELIGYNQFDIIYINGVFSWKFSILPIIAAKRMRFKRIMVGSRGMLAQSALNIKSFKKMSYLKIARMLNFYSNVEFHATNTKEKDEINRSIGSVKKIHLVENFGKKIKKNSSGITKQAGELKLISVARVSEEKNTLLAIQLLNNINHKISLDIYGQIYDQKYWDDCMNEIKKLPPSVSVNHKGTIAPEKIDGVLSEYHCMFLPTKGENFGHSIFEALAAGRPVLISDQTPWLDLEQFKAGKVVSLENKEGFVSALSEMVEMDQSEYDQWVEGARDYADDYLAKSDLKRKYLEMFS